MGYDFAKKADNKAAFIKLLESYEIPYRLIKHTDLEFEKYLEFVQEASTMTVNALKSKKWIVMDSKDFKMAVMCLRTERADDVRRYYISLEKLFKIYCEYTLYHLMR